jgi:hypothetical protein
MTDERWVRALRETAREEAEAPLPEELARPLDAAELDALDAALDRSLPSPKAPARARSGRRASMRWVAVMAPIAVAAGVLLAIRGPRAAKASLPVYELSVEGSQQATRGGDPAPRERVVRLKRSGQLTVLLTPQAPIAVAVGARAFIDAKSVLTPWNVPARVSPEGAVRIEASGEALRALPDGDARVVVEVAPDGDVPASAGDARRAMDGTPGVQVFTVRVSTSP